MQNQTVSAEQLLKALYEAIDNPDLIRGGKAVDMLRGAATGLYNAIGDREKQLEELKVQHEKEKAEIQAAIGQHQAKAEAEAKESALWRKKYEELEAKQGFSRAPSLALADVPESVEKVMASSNGKH